MKWEREQRKRERKVHIQYDLILLWTKTESGKRNISGKMVLGILCIVFALFLLIAKGFYYIFFVMLFAGIGLYLILQIMKEQGKIKISQRISRHEEDEEEVKSNGIATEAQASVTGTPDNVDKPVVELPSESDDPTTKILTEIGGSVKAPTEEQLKKWAARLEAREKGVEEKERKISTIYRNQQELIEELQKQKLSERELEQLQDSISKMSSVHNGLMDWVKRRENDEIALFEEMIRDIERYKEFVVHYAEMDGDKFEGHIAELLGRNGYENIVVTQKSRDYGGDITADKDGVRYVFQCKYYASPVGIGAVQQVHSAKEHYGAHVAVAVTNNVFTKSSQLLAQENGVVLWDCSKVEKLERFASDDGNDGTLEECVPVETI